MTVPPNPPVPGPGAEPDELLRLRADIEHVDHDIVRLIARRVALARQVGAVKQAAGLPALDPGREASVIRRVSEVARDEGAPEEDMRYLFWHIIGMSRRVQLTGE